MFEQELYNLISNNFSVEGFDIGIGFGAVEESQKAPYIVMYPLSNDGTRQVLCDCDNYTDGECSIQFNVYDTDYSNAMYIGRQLDIFLAKLRILPSYRVLLNNTEVIRGFPDVNTGLSIETVTRLFTYTQSGNFPLLTSQGLLGVYDYDLLTVKV